MIEKLSSAIAAADIIENQHFFPAAFGRGKMEMECRFFRCQFDPFQPVQLGLASPCLFCLDSGLIFADVFFCFMDVFLLLAVGIFQRLAAGAALFHIPRIISFILRNRPMAQFQDSRSDPVKEIPVMGYDEDSAAIGKEIAFQPFQHIHIEMVRRFVEKQVIRTPYKSFSQVDARLLTAGKTLYGPVHIVFPEAQTLDDFTAHGFIFESSQPFEPLLHVGVAVHQFLIIGLALHLFFYVFQLSFQTQDILPGGSHCIPERHTVFIGDVLLQVSYGFSFGNDKSSPIILFVPDEAFEECRFTCPVGPDQPEPFSPAQFKGYIVENIPYTERLF